jgi:archaellum component FlaF (FlaF/FlaG flagellin family)
MSSYGSIISVISVLVFFYLIYVAFMNSKKPQTVKNTEDLYMSISSKLSNLDLKGTTKLALFSGFLTLDNYTDF